ncbi:hypothetical protein [Streptomyces sp. NPDC048385]|uniref:hypothetical protein n=1 Tax=Streptomyces sp. NPDC048385 TaxID=3155145 RepID=UPI00342DFD29
MTPTGFETPAVGGDALHLDGEGDLDAGDPHPEVHFLADVVELHRLFDGDGQFVKETLPGSTTLSVDYEVCGSETEPISASRKSPTSRRICFIGG